MGGVAANEGKSFWSSYMVEDKYRVNETNRFEKDPKQTMTMNRQSIQSRGGASGTGVSVKSAKSGKSNHS